MLHHLAYWLVYLLFQGISRLPFWVLYRISDVFYYLLYYVVGYRKQVAYDNLRRCFPEKSEAEIQALLKASYEHLADMFVEFFKGMTISEAAVTTRMQDLTPDITAEIDRSSRGIYALASHCGNFEWSSPLFAAIFKHKKVAAIYQPLRSPIFNRLVVGTRAKRGAELIPMKNATEVSIQRIKANYLVGTLCDQAPSRAKKLYYTRLFNMPTATHTKFAHVILANEFPTCYIKINKVRRGYYTIQFIPIDIQPFLPYNEANALRLVDYYNNLLEQHIRENPAQWLWTHNRWKHPPQAHDTLSPLLSPAT